jgi:hypothetical protein
VYSEIIKNNLKLCPKYRAEFFIVMPRGNITKDIVICEVLKLKADLDKEWMNKSGYDPKWLAHHYLNKVLEKLNEYRF